jgi:hypothetical protein
MDTRIFECNDEPQRECFGTDLFGARGRWPLQVKGGRLCLLCNYAWGLLLTVDVVY